MRRPALQLPLPQSCEAALLRLKAVASDVLASRRQATSACPRMVLMQFSSPASVGSSGGLLSCQNPMRRQDCTGLRHQLPGFLLLLLQLLGWRHDSQCKRPSLHSLKL